MKKQNPRAPGRRWPLGELNGERRYVKTNKRKRTSVFSDLHRITERGELEKKRKSRGGPGGCHVKDHKKGMHRADGS